MEYVLTKFNDMVFRRSLLAASTALLVAGIFLVLFTDTASVIGALMPVHTAVVYLLGFSILVRVASLIIVVTLGIKLRYKTPALLFGYFILASIFNSSSEFIEGGITHENIDGAIMLACGGVFMLMTAVILYPVMLEHMQTKVRLKEQNGLLRSMLENVPFDFWAQDLAGTQIFQSKEGRKMWAELKDPASGKDDVTDEVRKIWEENHLRVMLGETVKADRRYSVPATGEVRWYHEVVAPYFMDGNIAGILGINVDLTEQHRTEERVLVQTSALAAAANGIVITDRNGMIEWANPAFVHMTGYSVEEAAGKNPKELLNAGMHPKSFFKEMWDTILSGQPWRGELINRKKDGSTYIEEMTITPVRDEQGEIVRFIAIKNDITERRKNERTIQQNEQNLRLYLDNSPLGIFIIDEQGHYTDVNPAGLEQSGYTREEMLRLTVQDFTAESSMDKAVAHFTSLMATGRADGEVELRRKDGSTFHARVIAVRLPDGRAIGITENIEERRKAQEEAWDHQRKMETLISNLPGYVYRAKDDFVHAGNSRLQYVSSGVEAITGLTPEQIFHDGVRKFFEHIPKEDQTRCWDAIGSAVAQRTVFEMEYRFIRPDGEVRWLWEQGRGVFNREGEYEYTEGYVVDITTRKSAELSVLQIQRRFAAFFEQSAVGMVITDLNGNFISTNHAFQSLSGYASAEVEGMSFRTMTYPDDKYISAEAVLRALSGERQKFRFEKRFVRKDGAWFWANVLVTLIRDAAGSPVHFAVIVEDITLRRATQRAVQALASISPASAAGNIFDQLVERFAEAVGADSAFIGLTSAEGDSIHTMAACMDGKPVPNFTFGLSSSPCNTVLHTGTTHIAEGLQRHFPHTGSPLAEGMTSYYGTAIVNGKNERVGVLAAYSRTPLESIRQYEAVHSLFSERISNELARLEADAELKRSEEQFRFLVEKSLDVVVRLDVFGRILYCSPSIQHVAGYDPAAVIGRSFKTFFVRLEQRVEVFTQFQHSVLNDESHRYEFEFLTADGRVIWMESVGRAVRMGRGTVEVQVMLRDISERKRSEEALRQYQQIISVTEDSIVLVDENSCYRIVNDAWLHRFDRTREEIEGRSIADVLGVEVYEKVIRPNLLEAFAGRIVKYQSWFDFPKIGRRFMDLQYLPYEFGGQRNILITGRDITDILTAEKEAGEANERFRAVWNSSGDAMRLMDGQGTIVMVNDAFCTMFGKEKSTLEGAEYGIVYRQEKHEESMRTFRNRFKERTMKEFVELEVELWNGRRFDAQLSNRFLTLPDGEVLVLSVFRDITARVAAERQLKENEERYRAIVGSSFDGFCTMDLSGRLLEVNEAYCRMTGFTTEEMLGLSIRELNPWWSDEQLGNLFDVIMDNGGGRFEIQQITKSGRITVEVNTVVLKSQGVIIAFVNNITDRKRAMERVRESERRFRGILEDVSLCSIILDQNACLTMINDHLLQLTGYDRAEVLGKPWFDLFLPDEVRGPAKESFFAALKEKKILKNMNGVIVTRSGQHRIVSWTHILMFDETHEVTSIASIGEDITEAQRMEEALLEREEQYRSLITSMQQGMALHEVVYDAQGLVVDYRFIEVNESFEHLTGLRRAEIIGRTVLQVLPSTERYWIEAYGRVAMTGEPIHFENYSAELGKHFDVAAYRPKVHHFAVIITDVTDRKRADERVQQSERQYRLLAENSTDVIWTMDLSGKFTYVSPSVLALRGFTPEEVLAQTLEEVVCPGSIGIVTRGVQRAIEHAHSGEELPREYVMIEQPRKDGTTVWTEVIVRIMYDEHRAPLGLLGITRDITERKRNEDLLRTRLTLSEYANDHSVKELLRRILDEAEKITESAIGFFHFVDDDQKTIALQTWSTNTLQNMCHAEGDGQHYPIDQAGVWVECVYTKHPVVHNDFASLTNKKGMPEGHAPVHRELLIPILRNEKVVGIMGVGNKQYQYDDRDVRIVSDLADMAWEILERRRAELTLKEHQHAVDGLSKAAVILLHMSDANANDMIHRALEAIGTGMEMDRVLLFRNEGGEGDEIRTSLAHEWIAKQEYSLIGQPFLTKMPMKETMPNLYAAVTAGRSFDGNIRSYPEPEASKLSRLGVLGYLSVPIMVEGHFWGLLAVESLHEIKWWTNDHRAILGVAAESLGIALERMSAVKHLYESEQMLKFALDASGDGIWTYTIPTDKLYISPETRKLIGIDDLPEHLNLKDWFGLVHPEDRQEAQDSMVHHVQGQTPIYYNEHRLLCGNGEYRWMLDRGKVLRWQPDGSPLQIFGTYSDIHQQKLAAKELQELNLTLEQKVDERTKQLQESVQQMESFSYSISHDLRAPVRAIDSFSSMLMQDEVQRLSDDGVQQLRKVRLNTARMGQMIDDLLQFSRAGRGTVRKVSFDLGAIATRLLEELTSSERGRTFSLSVRPMPEAYGDPSLLRQVLVNLLQNAVKFTRQAETAVIEVGGEAVEGLHRYWVKDNGIGFDMQYVDKLFGVFQRLHTQEEFEGTGVGLAIVQRILQKHSGRIWVESTPGHGTTFTFELPAAESSR